MYEKKYIGLAITILIIGLVINSMFTTQYSNFQIVGIKLDKVTIIDTSIPKGTYYLLKPEIKLCNGKRVFFGGSFDSGIGGCIEKIKDIVITDSLGNSIENHFSGFENMRLDTTCVLLSNINNSSDAFYIRSNSNLRDLTKRINAKEREEVGNRIWRYRIFYLKSGYALPKNIKIIYSTHIIDGTVNNTPTTYHMEYMNFR